MDLATKLRLAFLIGLGVIGLLIGLIGLGVQLARRGPTGDRDHASAVTASVLVPREGRLSR